jgi:hypothetical protein
MEVQVVGFMAPPGFKSISSGGVIWFREEEEPRWQLAHGLVEHL